MNPLAYESHFALADLHYARATGAAPEMECSKEAARIVSSLSLSPGVCIADVGCGSGHYLRSLRNQLEQSFIYTGFELHDIFIERARMAWSGEPDVYFRQGSVDELPASDGQFDVTICSNLLMHVPALVKPLSELIRITRSNLLLRLMVGTKTYKIQEVYNSDFWPSSQTPPEFECNDDGTPVNFEYENIWSEAYLRGVIARCAPSAQVEIWDDAAWEGANIEATRESGVLPNATRVISGMQFFDYILLPYKWVLVTL